MVLFIFAVEMIMGRDFRCHTSGYGHQYVRQQHFVIIHQVPK